MTLTGQPLLIVLGVLTVALPLATLALWGGDPPAPGSVTVRSDNGFSTPAEWQTRGRMESVQIHGPITQIRTEAHVYLLPQYFQRRYAHTAFPVAEVFTGYPGSNQMLVHKLHYPMLLLRDLHRHTARPMVLVMLRSAVVYPRDTECTDVPGGPQVETFLAQDVPVEMSRNYRIQPTGWGTIGDATGGYCAAKLTMMNPYIFHAAVSLSGYFTTLSDNTTGDLLWRLRHLPAPPVSVLVTSSRDEGGPLGVTNTERFLAAARPPLPVSSIIEPHGGHNVTTWGPQIPKALDWLSARQPPAVPR